MLRYFFVFNFKFDDLECEVIQLHIANEAVDQKKAKMLLFSLFPSFT